jgi:amino-acid N-acetyltransferase
MAIIQDGRCRGAAASRPRPTRIDGVGYGRTMSDTVAEADGAIVGAAGLEVYGTFGLLRSVVVAPSWRGRGLGGSLVRERLGYATSRGLHCVYLLTTTAPAWFARLGFTAVERENTPAAVRRSPEFSSICPSTAAVLEHRIARIATECCGSASSSTRPDRTGTAAPG